MRKFIHYNVALLLCLSLAITLAAHIKVHLILNKLDLNIKTIVLGDSRGEGICSESILNLCLQGDPKTITAIKLRAVLAQMKKEGLTKPQVIVITGIHHLGYRPEEHAKGLNYWNSSFNSMFGPFLFESISNLKNCTLNQIKSGIVGCLKFKVPNLSHCENYQHESAKSELSLDYTQNVVAQTIRMNEAGWFLKNRNPAQKGIQFIKELANDYDVECTFVNLPMHQTLKKIAGIEECALASVNLRNMILGEAPSVAYISVPQLPDSLYLDANHLNKNGLNHVMHEYLNLGN